MKAIIVVFTFILLVGCANHTYRYYEFKGDTVSTEYGKAVTVIPGEFVKVSEDPQITSFGNPYQLLVTFSTDVGSHSPTAVKNINIRSQNGEILYTFDGGEMETRWSSYRKSWFSAWNYKGLQLNHEPLTVEFDLIFIIDGREHRKMVTQEFEPKYREERSNDFIDGIMSV